MDFIDYNVCRILEAGVRLKELQQNSSCAEQNRAFRPGNCTKIEENAILSTTMVIVKILYYFYIPLEPNLVSNTFAQLLASFLGNSLSNCDGTDAPRLRTNNSTRGSLAALDGIVKEELRHLSSFSAT